MSPLSPAGKGRRATAELSAKEVAQVRPTGETREELWESHATRNIGFKN